jgi:hypothetical protein
VFGVQVEVALLHIVICIALVVAVVVLQKKLLFHLLQHTL